MTVQRAQPGARNQPVQQAQQACLAATVGTHQSQTLAAVQHQIDRLQCRRGAKTHCGPAQCDQGRRDVDAAVEARVASVCAVFVAVCAAGSSSHHAAQA